LIIASFIEFLSLVTRVAKFSAIPFCIPSLMGLANRPGNVL
jgi:hypothetical protein